MWNRASSTIRRALWGVGITGLVALAAACAPSASGAGEAVTTEEILSPVPQTVDVEAETEAILAAHGPGCGSLHWTRTRAPTGTAAFDGPTFSVGQVHGGKVLLNYLHADPDRPVLYRDAHGDLRQVSIPRPHGLVYLPEAGPRAPVWQEP